MWDQLYLGSFDINAAKINGEKQLDEDIDPILLKEQNQVNKGVGLVEKYMRKYCLKSVRDEC